MPAAAGAGNDRADPLYPYNTKAAGYAAGKTHYHWNSSVLRSDDNWTIYEIRVKDEWNERRMYQSLVYTIVCNSWSTIFDDKFYYYLRIFPLHKKYYKF